MSSLITVIVPIYKVEKYLNKCVNSIIDQTYKNLEIILVDDGSPDNCGAICDDYAKKDSRIKVVHKENGGLSDARNAGYEFANGEYVCFIDSDDYISKDFIQVLYETMARENSDIVECDIVRFNEDEEVGTVEATSQVVTYDTVEAMENLIEEKDFHQHVWNKLYKSDIALTVKFEKGKLNEDEFWTYQVFGKAKRVSKVTDKMYYYLQRKTSIMGQNFSLRRLDALEAKMERQQYIDRNFPELTTCAKVNFFGSCVYFGQCSIKFMQGKDKKQAKHIVKKYADGCKLNKKELRTIGGKSYYWYSFANKCLFLCCRLRNIARVGF